MNRLTLLLAASLLVPSAFAQKTEPLLISAETLSQHLGDSDIVPLHVGGKKEDYAARHIAGARFITLADISLPAEPGGKGLSLELPPAEVLRAKLAEMGISDDSHIVVYAGIDTSFQTMTRVVFTLQYLGLGDRTSVLNGGFKAWTDEKKPDTTAIPAIAPGKLAAKPTLRIVADAALVQTAGQKPNFKLVDARATNFYNGTDAAQGKNGHIPGAVSVPFSLMLDSNSMVDQKQVQKAFQDAGVKPGDTVVAYCHIGQQATAVIFGARLLGNPVMLYDGSFQDWAINNRGPVEK